ncbi:unnamed protein product [Acanthoscelides obtectus]|uniref:Uncharacterized protein n=1 Tax=Acanthoscelides obtectus TaxID=200917 RepID=A0A9P0NVS4_ACAOB|nr:unnamed protein product [Acanthoscelides obtectus]CAK1667963.1 hypothetical protein AOBTE_LOCUS26141 [Acanthoscelides obtectus]
MKTVVVLYLTLFFIYCMCISSSLAYPSNGESPTCYGQVCPEGTTSCKKNIRSSLNRRNLEIRINCLDDFDGSLKEYYFEEVNNMDPNVHYESSSYSGTNEDSAKNKASYNRPYVSYNGLEDLY